jgi:hypothetical protein
MTSVPNRKAVDRADIVDDYLALALGRVAKRLCPDALGFDDIKRLAPVIGAMVIAQAILQASEDAR